MISGINHLPQRTIGNGQQFRAALSLDVTALSAPNVKLHQGEVSVTWQPGELPALLKESGFQSIRYCIRLYAEAVGPGGKSLLLTVAAQVRGDRPYLDQSLQAERGVGSKYMLMDGEFKRFNSNPDLSTPANLQRLSEASLATTDEILREVLA